MSLSLKFLFGECYPKPERIRPYNPKLYTYDDDDGHVRISTVKTHTDISLFKRCPPAPPGRTERAIYKGISKDEK